MNFEGENISLKDALFVDNITGDLESFRVRSESVARVLVFPPVSNYHRFLIHKVVETGFPQFTTFSVGEGIHRRTTVAFQLHLFNLIHKKDIDDLSSTTDKNTSSAEVVKEITDSKETSTQEVEENSKEILEEAIDSVTAGDFICDREGQDTSEMTAEHEQSAVATEHDCGNLAEQNSGEHDASKRKSKRPARAVYVPPRGRGSSAQESPTKLKAKPKKSPQKPTKEVGEKELIDVEDDAAIEVVDEKKIDDTLDVTEQIVSEITEAVGGVQIEAPQVDYISFQTSDSSINIDQFGHVIELYDFPSTHKTTDLVNAFQAFTSRWDIKWVDDTHALGVFSSCEVAAEALAVRHPTIATRPLNMATPQSKLKAQIMLEELLPYKPRPVSCTAPARRLLQRALGSSMRVPEASKLENDRLKEAQKKKEEVRRREGVDEERKKRREVEERGRGDKKYRFGHHDDR